MITLGGDAELELVDTLDPFSEGIVFSVRPPKKSWKNISNLSGGEKTLSSLALVSRSCFLCPREGRTQLVGFRIQCPSYLHYIAAQFYLLLWWRFSAASVVFWENSGYWWVKWTLIAILVYVFLHRCTPSFYADILSLYMVLSASYWQSIDTILWWWLLNKSAWL